jgi:porphobilinogen deaminase
MTIDYDRDQLSYALANALNERDEAREKNARFREIISRANRDYDEQIELFRSEVNKLRDIAERAVWRMVAGACLSDAGAIAAMREEGLRLRAELGQLKGGAK